MSVCVFCGGDHHLEVKCFNPPIPSPSDPDNQESVHISELTETIQQMRKTFSAIKMRCAIAACERPSWSQTCFAEITKLCEEGLNS